MAGRFIKLYDKILNWEWYHDTNTFRLFIHLLLKANYKDGTFQGFPVKRGQLVTSLTSLSASTSLSIRQVRDSLDKLKMTGEVTSTAYPKYRVISIVRYDEYQTNDKQSDKQMTSKGAGKGQANDKQTDKQTGSETSRKTATSIEYIESIEKNRNIEQIEGVGETAPRPSAPTIEEIRTYCEKNGLTINVERFYSHYTDNGWKSKNGKPIPDWRVKAREWYQDDMRKAMEREKAPKPEKRVIAQDFPQRDYSDANDDQMKQLEEDMKRFRETGEI